MNTEEKEEYINQEKEKKIHGIATDSEEVE